MVTISQQLCTEQSSSVSVSKAANETYSTARASFHLLWCCLFSQTCRYAPSLLAKDSRLACH